MPELAKGVQGKSGRTAVVFGKGFFLQFAMILANSQTVGKDMQIKFFADREKALAWLQEILEPVLE
jgi:hypothetical protein